VIAAIVLWYIGKRLVEQWSKFRDQPLTVHPRWGMIALSAAITLVAYALLIETWRRIVVAWGDRLGFADAARIWFVSNLVRYVPGGTAFQLMAMAELSRRRRISPAAAAGASVINVAVNIATGFIVALVAGYAAVDRLSHGHANLGVAVALLTLAGVLLLPVLLPHMLGFLERTTGRVLPIGRLPVRAVYISLAGNLAAWILYGLSYRALVAGVVGSASGSAGDYIAVYAAAYVLGYLVFAAPAGLGAREGAQIDALPALGLATLKQATLISAVARLMSMVLDIVPGLILLSRGTRPRSQEQTDQHGPNG
jgi:glycosyltransferase 2 family protein